MQPTITSHAACKGHAPENTLAGIRAALRHKADAIEVDVRVTRDGTPVLLHDNSVDRTTDGEGRIDSLSLRQARKLDAGMGETIPTLRELLKAVSGRALLVLEVKAANIEEAVLAVVHRERALDWCAIHSFWPQTVERFRKLERRMPASLLTNGQGVKDWAQFLGFALSLGAQGVSIHHSVLTPKLVRMVHLREMRCAAWTANTRDEIRRAAATGADAITTDYPDRARRWLPKR